MRIFQSKFQSMIKPRCFIPINLIIFRQLQIEKYVRLHV